MVLVWFEEERAVLFWSNFSSIVTFSRNQLEGPVKMGSKVKVINCILLNDNTDVIMFMSGDKLLDYACFFVIVTPL